jgi:hypothetical protein
MENLGSKLKDLLLQFCVVSDQYLRETLVSELKAGPSK